MDGLGTNPQKIIAELKRKLDQRTVERDAALAQQTAATEVLQVINSSTGNLAPVFDTIVEKAARLCDAYGGALWIVENGMARATGGRGGNMPEPFYDYVEHESVPVRYLLGRDGQDRPFVHTADLKATRPYQQGVPFFVANVDLGAARTSLGVPLMEAGTLIGVFTLIRREVRPFTENQIAVVQNFAAQAVIAIQNARLFNETKEALERQTATADILKVIASSPSDVQPVFDAIATSANRLIGGFSATVFRFADNLLHLVAFTPINPRDDEALKASFPRSLEELPLLGLVRGGDVAQITDTETSPEVRALARSRGFRSMLFAPLMNDGAPIGMISVTRKEPGTFAARHVELLRTFADQAVIAIENARLLAEVQARTEDLRESLQQQTATAEVLKVISRSAFDLQAVFDTLISSAVELSGAFNGTICLRERDGYRYLATSGIQGEFRDFLIEHPPTPGLGSAAGRVILSGNVVSIPDVLKDPDYLVPAFDMNNTRSVLGVPLLRNDTVEGALVLSRIEPGLFSERQIELVQTFADQAVIAIENVRLFDEVQARTKELAASVDELRTAQDRLVQTEKLASLGQLTAGIAHEIKNPLNFVNNFSALAAELTDELNNVLESAALGDEMREEVAELTGMLRNNLEKVVQHGKRADSIVKSMLLHSREGSGEHRSTDINALLDQSLNLAYHGARAEKSGFNITLQRNFDPGAGTVEAFPQEVTRAFLNLISNGFYAAAKRKTDNGDPDFEPLLSATTKNLGSTVEIRIRDNGTGIPPEVKENIFNPFFTTKPAGEGTGLGLSISHDIIVKQHGGRLGVDTRPGQFTEFTIVLPRTSNHSKKV
jgi:two-component system NtrC family sensor kinase